METLGHSRIHSGTNSVCAFVTGLYVVAESLLCVSVCVQDVGVNVQQTSLFVIPASAY